LNIKRPHILLIFIICLTSITALPISADEYVILFEDNFQSDNLSSNWRVFGDGTAAISETSLGRALECKDYIWCSTGDNDLWTDYGLKTHFSLISGQAFIDFRFHTYINNTGKKVNEWYRWIIKPGGFGLVKIQSMDAGDGNPQEISKELISAPAPINTSTEYLIAGWATGNQLWISINDINLNKISELKFKDDSPIISGVAAVGTNVKGSVAYFSQIIWTKDITAQSKTTSPSVSSPVAVVTPRMTPSTGSNQPQATFTVNNSIPPTTRSSAPLFSLTPINLATIIGLISLIIAILSFTGVQIARRIQSRQKRRLKVLINEIDDIYMRFKMNTRRCEAELYRFKDVVNTDLKEGNLEEGSFSILDKRLDMYMNEIQERIIDESLGSFPAKLRELLVQMTEKHEVDEYEFNAIEKIILTSKELSDTDRVRLKESLSRWKENYLKKKQ
jgi:hypothetical protein